MESMSDPKQIGRDAMAFVIQAMSKNMTTDEIYIAIMGLHEKHPLPERNQPLTLQRILNRKKSVVHLGADNGIDVDFLGDMDPMTFKEAAEMFARGRNATP
jgi:hypothetical protein